MVGNDVIIYVTWVAVGHHPRSVKFMQQTFRLKRLWETIEEKLLCGNLPFVLIYAPSRRQNDWTAICGNFLRCNYLQITIHCTPPPPSMNQRTLKKLYVYHIYIYIYIYIYHIYAPSACTPPMSASTVMDHLFHKSNDTPVPYPKIHHSEQKFACFCSK